MLCVASYGFITGGRSNTEFSGDDPIGGGATTPTTDDKDDDWRSARKDRQRELSTKTLVS